MNGLPALAQNLASRGRNGDSMLVHMTPGEVRGLQALAMTQGGSLTTNPDTGLVEANFLKNLLPTIAGIGLTMMGVPPTVAAMAVGGVETVRTGDLGRGIMAGLGAYGGSSLGTALGSTGAAAGAGAAGATPTAMGLETFNQAAVQPSIGLVGPGEITGTIAPNITSPAITGALPAPAAPTLSSMGAGVQDLFQPGGFSRFGDAFSQAAAGGGAPSTFKTALAGLGAATPVLESLTPQYKMPTTPEEESTYAGPYTPTPRQIRYPTEEERRRMGTGEFMYFSPSNPVPFQEGGDVSVSPAEAQVYQNIANVQRMGGLPAIDIGRLNVRPTMDRSALVYNPITPRVVPIPTRMERSYGFSSIKPGTVTPAAIGGKGIVNTLVGSGEYDEGKPLPGGVPEYEYDPVTNSIVPTRAYRNRAIAEEQKIREEQRAAEIGAQPWHNPSSPQADGFAKGGVPMLEDGGFVLTKKAVDGLGKGNNKRGQEVASRGLGAIPIKGPGTGTSDSIPTSIEGKQPALVSNGEAYVPKKQVNKRGGAKKFYALMRAAERRA